jgi:hypothetical protein
MARSLRDTQIADGRRTESDGSDPRFAITPAQYRVAHRLALGEDLTMAAVRAGVHPERARRWLKVPRFQRAILRVGTPLTNANPADVLLLGVEVNKEETDVE